MIRGSILLAMAGLVAASAFADVRVRKFSADIDDLDAELFLTRDGWELVVEYEVDAEPWHPEQGIRLVLHARERGALLRDRDGRPLEVLVELTRPRELTGNEATFSGRARIGLPRAAIRDPDELRVYAALHWSHDERVLDRDDVSVDFDEP